jgi:hypothetical protein
MQFKQVLGNRRSTRLWLPWRPVEEWKLQAILEAINQAPRLLEVDFLRAVVMRLGDLTEQQLRDWQTPTTTTQLEMVPILLWVFADLDALERAQDGAALRRLMEVGALNESHGWTEASLDAKALACYRRIRDAQPQMGVANGGFTQDAAAKRYSLELISLARSAVGFGQAYALLAGTELGLGVQLSAVPAGFARQFMKVPGSWIGGSPVFIGYAAEAPGGQRPKEALGETVFEGRYGRPFVSDPATEARLRAEGLIQEPIPTPSRRGELRRVSRMFGLPE